MTQIPSWRIPYSVFRIPSWPRFRFETESIPSSVFRLGSDSVLRRNRFRLRIPTWAQFPTSGFRIPSWTRFRLGGFRLPSPGFRLPSRRRNPDSGFRLRIPGQNLTSTRLRLGDGIRIPSSVFDFLSRISLRLDFNSRRNLDSVFRLQDSVLAQIPS